jgi:hypothetical protein
MKSRIEHLTRELQSVNAELESLKALPLCPPSLWQDTVARYEPLARERTWLETVLLNFPLPVSRDGFDEQWHDVQVWLEIAPATWESPLGVSDAISVKNGIYLQFRYPYRVIDPLWGEDGTARKQAEELTWLYTKSIPKLWDATQGVYYANFALYRLEAASRWWSSAFGEEDQPLRDVVDLCYGLNYLKFPQSMYRESVWPTALPYAEFVVQVAANSDDYLKRLKESAGEYWETARKLIARARQKNLFEIVWEPFKVKDKSSTQTTQLRRLYENQ